MIGWKWLISLTNWDWAKSSLNRYSIARLAAKCAPDLLTHALQVCDESSGRAIGASLAQSRLVQKLIWSAQEETEDKIVDEKAIYRFAAALLDCSDGVKHLSALLMQRWVGFYLVCWVSGHKLSNLLTLYNKLGAKVTLKKVHSVSKLMQYILPLWLISVESYTEYKTAVQENPNSLIYIKKSSKATGN